MTIKITLEFATAAEARAALAALDSAEVNRQDDTVRASLQAKRDTVKAAKVKPPKDEAAAPAEPPEIVLVNVKEFYAAQAVAQAEEKPAITVDYPTVQAAILKVANAKGRDTALELLTQFNVKAGKELKPEQYEAALAAFNTALEA